MESAIVSLKAETRAADAIPELYFRVKRKMVYTLFDVPHLFKSIRNNCIGNFFC